MGTEVSDFNLHYISQWGRNVFLVAGRFYDLAPDRWEYLSCCWYGRHGLEELPNDRYLTETMVRFRSVDDLVAEKSPELNAVGQHLYDGWVACKKKLEETRKKPPVVILPPPPSPEPLPLPDDLKPNPIPVPQPAPAPVKKNPNPALVRFSVYFGLLASAATAAAFFWPPIKPWVAMIVPIIKALLTALGV